MRAAPVRAGVAAAVWACLATAGPKGIAVAAPGDPAPTAPVARRAGEGAAVEPSPLLDLGGAWRRGRSAALLALLDEHVEGLLRRNPLDASRRGDRRYDDLLPDPSPEAADRERAGAADRLARLDALDPSAFTPEDRLDADLLRYELSRALDAARFHPEHTPMDARWGPHASLPQMADGLSIRTERDRAAYARRLERVAPAIDATIGAMRAGLAAGRVPPKVAMAGAAEACDLQATPEIEGTPSLSPFFRPLAGAAAAGPDAESAARARAAIAGGIVPAYRRLAAFLRDEYVPACRDDVAYGRGVDGPAAYDQALRHHTTTDLSAERIHAIGLAEVDRLRAAMIATIGRTDFPRRAELEGDDLLRAFVEHLRTDRRFYFDTPEALLAGYRDVCKRIDAELPRLFGRLPRLTYGVRSLPATAAPSSPTAYYYAGSLAGGVPAWFIANTYRLDQRPKYEMVPLALHEAVPGHHLQIALSQELEGRHPFRTALGYTAFVEGWALYAESLGLEVGGESPGDGGMYRDPYDDFGRLNYEMWRACRLVVDTGMHALGWTRGRAVEFMTASTALSPLNIEREVDRYIAWPGQACAYKIGEMRIRALRARAEAALGPAFDVRAFHDAVLDGGALPLPVLEAKIGRWIEAQGGGAGGPGPGPGAAP